MREEYETLLHETVAPAVVRIFMNRPAARNAQNLQMTFDLTAAFDRAAQYDKGKVIILAGADPVFSAGHDLCAGPKPARGGDFRTLGTWAASP